QDGVVETDHRQRETENREGPPPPLVDPLRVCIHRESFLPTEHQQPRHVAQLTDCATRGTLSSSPISAVPWDSTFTVPKHETTGTVVQSNRDLFSRNPVKGASRDLRNRPPRLPPPHQ